MDDIGNVDYENISSLRVPNIKAFFPIVNANPGIHTAIANRKTYQYGDTERHQLDVYPPDLPANAPPPPIVVFIYGGGFTTGDRQIFLGELDKPPYGTYYANIGHFFSKRGFLTVIIDYRLAPQYKYPSGAVDCRDALDWLVNNISTVSGGGEGGGGADIDRLFVVGQSAGGVHIMHSLISPDLPPSRYPADERAKIAGLVPLGAAFHCPTGPAGNHYLLAYYDTIDADALQPLGMLNAENTTKNLPPMLIIMGEHEPVWLMRSGKKVLEELVNRYGKKDVSFKIAKGHNHLSTFLAIGIEDAEAEEWAIDAVRWMHQIAPAPSQESLMSRFLGSLRRLLKSVW